MQEVCDVAVPSGGARSCAMETIATLVRSSVRAQRMFLLSLLLVRSRPL